MKKYLKNKKIIAGLAVVVIIFLLTRGKGGNGAKTVSSYTVTKTEVIKNISASGKTQARKQMVMKSPVSAKIAQVMFSSGDAVKKGDVIIKFDYNSLKAASDSTWAAYLAAKATNDSLEDQIESAKKSADSYKFARDKAWRTYMGDDGETSKQAFKTAEANYRAAETSVTALQDKRVSLGESVNASLQSYQVTKDNLNNVNLRAQEDGYLALENLNTNDAVLTGQKVFTISNQNGLEFLAEIDETDIDSIAIDQPVKVTIDGYPNDTFEGKVTNIDAKTTLLTNGSNIIQVNISFDLKSKRPIVGMSGNADIEVGKEAAHLAVPFDAVIFGEENKNYVFIINKTAMTVTKKEIQTGFEGNDYIVVLAGLNEGDLIASGAEVTSLIDGSKISFDTTK